jgi:hypothetical protein
MFMSVLPFNEADEVHTGEQLILRVDVCERGARMVNDFPNMIGYSNRKCCASALLL